MTKGIDDVLDRIRKLLALSTSSNEHEAALAAARAAELMLQYQLSEAQLEPDGEADEPVDAHVIDKSGKKIAWKAMLCDGLAHAFGCQIGYSVWRHARSNKVEETGLTVFGRASDVAAVRYLYEYLSGEVSRLANVAYVAKRYGLLLQKQATISASARAWKHAFRMGAATTIHKRLAEEKAAKMAAAAADPSMAKALVRLDQRVAAVEAYLAGVTLLRNSAALGSLSDADGYAHGRQAGKGVDLGTNKRALTPGVPRLGGKVAP